MAERDFNFIRSHEVTFGLKISDKHLESNIVTSVVCRFCSHYGRDDVVGAKRKKKGKVKLFEYPFKGSNFKSQLNGQHAEAWEDYQNKSPALKATYFDDVTVGGTVLTHFDREKKLTRVLVEKTIVDGLICEILLHYGED